MSLTWRCNIHSQRLRLDDSVIAHLNKHRQMDAQTSEAGGQVFGTVTDVEVRVMSATGPYRSDDRGRYSYRSDVGSAQKAIKTQKRNGLMYLGEWHSHAENVPTPSEDDFRAMKTLHAQSRLSATSVLLVIVGRADFPAGLCVYSFGEYNQIIWYCGDKLVMHKRFASQIKKMVRTFIARYKY